MLEQELESNCSFTSKKKSNCSVFISIKEKGYVQQNFSMGTRPTFTRWLHKEKRKNLTCSG